MPARELQGAWPGSTARGQRSRRLGEQTLALTLVLALTSVRSQASNAWHLFRSAQLVPADGQGLWL